MLNARSTWIRYGALAVLFLVTLAAFGQRAYDSLDLTRHMREYARAPFFLGDAAWGAIVLQPEAQTAGMKNGDAILTVDGRPINGFVDYYGPLRTAKPGDRLVVRVREAGPLTNPIRQLTITLRPYLE